MKKRLVSILAAFIAALMIAAVVYFDYYVWELKHPDAPVWTYFVK